MSLALLLTYLLPRGQKSAAENPDNYNFDGSVPRTADNLIGAPKGGIAYGQFPSRGHSTIVLKQPAKPLPALDAGSIGYSASIAGVTF